MRTYPIIINRLPKTAHSLSLGAGIFGWTATHVQANKVEKQLQMMPHIDLLPNLSASRAKIEGEKSIGISEGVGSAKEEPNERYNKAQMIIVLAG